MNTHTLYINKGRVKMPKSNHMEQIHPFFWKLKCLKYFNK